MIGRLVGRTARLAVVAGAMAGVPEIARAQACTPGPLSAYLASAGLGCSVGNLKFSQFAQSNLGSFASQIWVTPFTLQGPPGYTWHGFSLQFQAPSLHNGQAATFSFMSEGSPLYGLHVTTDGTPTVAFNTGASLTGDGGVLTARDYTRNNNNVITKLLSACHVGVSCLNGVSQWLASTSLTDTDGIYQVAASSRWEQLGPGDHAHGGSS